MDHKNLTTVCIFVSTVGALQYLGIINNDSNSSSLGSPAVHFLSGYADHPSAPSWRNMRHPKSPARAWFMMIYVRITAYIFFLDSF